MKKLLIAIIAALTFSVSSVSAAEKPIGFSWDVPIHISQADGKYQTDFDITAYAPTGKTYYVDNAKGSNSNDGLSPIKAFKSMSTALSKTDGKVIMVAAGVYARIDSIQGLKINRDVSIKAYGGRVIFGSHDLLKWTLAPGYTKTYQATRSSVDTVYDAAAVNQFGDYKKYAKKSSVSEVNAQMGSWTQDGDKVYVHRWNDGVPGLSIRVNVLVPTAKVSGNVTVYAEGIDFIGGLIVTNEVATDNPRFYAKDCKFKYSERDNGLKVLGAEVYLVNCEAAQNAQDGFNYHARLGVISKAVEINCIGRNNGSIDNNDNGSTIHDGGKIIRVNGQYFGNLGPNVADVGNGTESWILGSTAYDSKSKTPQNFTFSASGGTMTAWMDTCQSYGSTFGIMLDKGAQVFTRNSRLEGKQLGATSTF